MIRKTSAMVEAGILAAIAIVFAIISMYVPVIGSFINFLWPLPIAICGMRNGLRWSVMTLIVADIAVAVLISPLHAFSLLAAFGLVGLTLGECMRRGYKPFKLMLISSVACLISIGASFLIALYIMGIQPVDMMFTSLEEAARESVGYYQSIFTRLKLVDFAVADNDFAQLVVELMGSKLIMAIVDLVIDRVDIDADSVTTKYEQGSISVDFTAALQQSRLQQKKVLDRSLFDVVHLVELVPQADGVLVKAKTEWK